MNELSSACGLDCLACECYLATQTGDQARKADIAIRWSKIYAAELTAQDINCQGCLSDGPHFGWCHKCPIRACARGKGFRTCAECSDFPCATNAFLYEAVPTAKQHIEKHRS